MIRPTKCLITIWSMRTSQLLMIVFTFVSFRASWEKNTVWFLMNHFTIISYPTVWPPFTLTFPFVSNSLPRYVWYVWYFAWLSRLTFSKTLWHRFQRFILRIKIIYIFVCNNNCLLNILLLLKLWIKYKLLTLEVSKNTCIILHILSLLRNKIYWLHYIVSNKLMR
jgi:hypothetical protein